MKERKQLRPATALSLGAILLMAGGAVEAATYSFTLDRFNVAGNLPGTVTDDFDDGSLSPFWEVYDPTIVESGTTATFSNPGTLDGPFQLGVLTLSSEMSYMGSTSPGSLQMQNGSGDFVGTSTWSAVLPGPNQLFEMGVDNVSTDEGFSILVHNFDAAIANELGVPEGPGVTFGRFGDVSNGDFETQGISFIPGDITGDILLRLAFNDATNTFSASFSLDGSDNYLTPFTDIATSAGTQEFGWSIGAESMSVVPVPAAAWFFGSALIGLVSLTRRKA